jgi:hypothetical protein
MDFTVPVGNHLFSPEALADAAKRALADLPEGKTGVMTGSVDVHGVNTAIVFNNVGGHFQAVAAWSHDWTGKDTFGVTGKFYW